MRCCAMPATARKYEAVKALAEFRRKIQSRAELYRRAIDSWDEPVYSRRTGAQIGTIRRYSDQLLEVIAKAKLREFSERPEALAALGAQKIEINVGKSEERDLSSVPEFRMDPSDLARVSNRRRVG